MGTESRKGKSTQPLRPPSGPKTNRIPKVAAALALAITIAVIAAGPWAYVFGGDPETRLICVGELDAVSDARSACFDSCETPGCDGDCLKECRAGCNAARKASLEAFEAPIGEAKERVGWCDANCAGSRQYVTESAAESSKLTGCMKGCADESCAKECRDAWNAERFERLAEHNAVCPEGLHACMWNAVNNASRACADL